MLQVVLEVEITSAFKTNAHTQNVRQQKALDGDCRVLTSGIKWDIKCFCAKILADPPLAG